MSTLAIILAMALQAPAADTLRLEVGAKELDGRVYKPHAARVRVWAGPGEGQMRSEWTNVLTHGDSAGRAVHRWVTTGKQVTAAGDTVSWVLRQTYDARTLQPYGIARSATNGAEYSYRVEGRHVTGTRRSAAAAPVEPVDFTIDRLGFVASASDLVPAAVGFRPGLVVSVPVWGPNMKAAEQRHFSIIGKTDVRVEGTAVNAWKVEERRAVDRTLLATWYLLDKSPYMAYGEVPQPDGSIRRITEVEVPHPSEGGRTPLTPGAFAVTNVSVVSMTSDRVTPNATVLVVDGRIAAVGSSRSVRIPLGASVIDGSGKYIMPGLADMHSHLYSDGDLPDSAAPAELGVMLANGVTTVRLMAGTPEQLRLRDRVRRGEVLGPQLWLASPMFADRPDQNARVITRPDVARKAVVEMKAAGYDFIKVTFGILDSTYDALTDEARRQRIPVVGHVEPKLGLARAIAAGQELEHLDAYFEGALADSAPMKESLTQYGAYRAKNWESLDYIDDRKLTRLAEQTARAGVWVGPTLFAFNSWFSTPLTDDELKALPDWRLIPEPMRTRYMTSRSRYWAQPVSRERRALYGELRNQVVKRIATAGGAGRILAGSDTPDLLLVYGFTLHRELQALVAAGLTPYQALAAATRNPAEFLGMLSEFGTVEVGKRADLLLLSADPLADVRNTQRIETVFVGGRIIRRPELARLIDDGASAIANGKR